MSQKDADTFLDLGWIVDSQLDPNCCIQSKERPDYSDMVRIPTKKMDKHTVIIAQSGSGKSFFLGRLVEEIMIKSKARCLILDPNGDFRKIYKIDEELWQPNQPLVKKYDIKTGKGKLTLETKDKFAEKWAPVMDDFIIKTNRVPKESNAEELKVWWPSISLEFLIQSDNPRSTEMFHCHNWAKELFNQFAQFSDDTDGEDIIVKVKNIFKSLQEIPNEEREKMVKRLRTDGKKMGENLGTITNDTTRTKMSKLLKNAIKSGSLYDSLISLGATTLDHESMEKAKFVFESYSWDTVNSYFGLIERYQALDVLAKRPYSSKRQRRLVVVDLPSINNNELRALVLNSILTEEWENAEKKWEEAMKSPRDEDRRVPTFIVLDEAHNFIPASPRSRHESLVREQFRTIAAEGRKFGLFLILVSQRPDKLDDLVLSECGNKAILHLDSQSMVDKVIKTLGLDFDIESIERERIVSFKPGRVLLAGNWACEHNIFYCAARRTLEGGRNLEDEYWARPT
ncbi:MAG: ATP-binding protein [Nitrososphaeraceae archaeon]|nr:ATP-binding protein [Nitrososphaeraceae archaeon]MDW0275713.1 ATP-binding protein [Nitrososphaeraceae archaeon]